MTLADLKMILETTGLPVAYLAWPKNSAPPLPFICYLCEGATNLFADASVYHQSTAVRIELYTRTKDIALEATMEEALSIFHWKKTETYINTEGCYLILYEIEV